LIHFKEKQGRGRLPRADAMILRMPRNPLRSRAAVIAILAMLLASLAPAITHAVKARPSLAMAAMICTQDRVPDAPHADVWDCCASCTASALPDVLPPPAWEPLRLAASAPSVPALFLLAPRPPFAWAAARSRAPPSAS
jgi:hypothetical protein